MELFFSFIFGTIIGSFLNVVVLRIPKDESIVFPASHCFSCNKTLKPWHNIPILSWIILRGKCGYCGAKISLQYPIIEILSGIIFTLLANKYTISLEPFLIALSFSMLLVLSAIDLKYKMVPDSINFLALIFAVFGAWDIFGVIDNLQNALLFAGGFTLLRFSVSYLLTSKAHKKAKKTLTPWTKNYHTYPFIEALGEGDIIVAATMGALLGVPLTLVAIFLSAVLALPVMLVLKYKTQKEESVPYVPFLAMATFLVYVFDTPILNYIQASY